MDAVAVATPERSGALRELLTACLRGDQVAALHTLGLHPGLINERWAGWGSLSLVVGTYIGDTLRS